MKTAIVAALLMFSGAAYASTGNVGVDEFYSIGNTDTIGGPYDKFWAHQTLTGSSHGVYATVIRPEGSLPYTRGDGSDEYQETGYPNATYTADSPLTVGTYFTHYSTMTTPVLATCSAVSVTFNSSFAPSCVPVFELYGNQGSGYTCQSHCEPLQSPLAQSMIKLRGKGRVKNFKVR